MYRVDYKEMAREMCKRVDNELDRMAEKADELKGYKQIIDGMDAVFTENDKLKDENESLQQQLADERRQRLELEMKMKEMSKLSAGVAKKASQDDLAKALRIYLNISKRKTVSKREAAKMVITEMLNSAKLELPEDILEMLEHLDDEQTESKVVHVSGNYNDIHDNGEVKGIKA